MITGITTIAGILATGLLGKQKAQGSSSLPLMYGLPKRITIIFDSDIVFPSFESRIVNCTTVADVWPFKIMPEVSDFLLNDDGYKMLLTDNLSDDEVLQVIELISTKSNRELGFCISTPIIGSFLEGDLLTIIKVDSPMHEEDSIITYDQVRDLYIQAESPVNPTFVKCTEYQYLWQNIIQKTGKISITIDLSVNPNVMFMDEETLLNKVQQTLNRSNVLSINRLNKRLNSKNQRPRIGSISLRNPVVTGWSGGLPLLNLEHNIRRF